MGVTTSTIWKGTKSPLVVNRNLASKASMTSSGVAPTGTVTTLITTLCVLNCANNKLNNSITSSSVSSSSSDSSSHIRAAVNIVTRLISLYPYHIKSLVVPTTINKYGKSLLVSISTILNHNRVVCTSSKASLITDTVCETVYSSGITNT